MAKKGQSTKSTKQEVQKSENTSVQTVDTDLNGTLKVDVKDVLPVTKIAPKKELAKKSIEVVGIETLVALEKACAIVCKRYETRARLDGENNIMFQKFSAYYADILKELEKRVEQSCLIPGDEQ